MTSWIIWSRFIRERTIRDIPDGLFSEYRFWILLYLCVIYLYVGKTLVKPNNSNAFLAYILELLLTPLKTLDHFIKYNIYTKDYKYMESFIYKIDNLNKLQRRILFYTFQIFPRSILVLFLVLDTVYYLKFEIFYKVILIGILPMLIRYINYSVKDLYNHWVETLENIYKFIYVEEKGYENIYCFTDDHTLAEYHHAKVFIEEYIEIKYYNMLQNEFEEAFPYEYVGTAYPKQEIYDKYSKTQNYDDYKEFTQEDFNEMDQLFKELMPKIFEVKSTLSAIDSVKEHFTIKWPRPK